MIHNFKALSSRRVNKNRGTPGRTIWQRNSFEHVIGGEQKLARIRKYIHENPLRWELDEENPLRWELEGENPGHVGFSQAGAGEKHSHGRS